MNISVAMATYNGEKFIKEQIESILEDLESGDEIVISDDGSEDDTVSIIYSFISADSRVHFVKGPGNGVVKNFENALKFCQNDVICFSDQDDIWIRGKRRKIISSFANKKIELVTHNGQLVDINGKPLDKTKWVKMRHGVWINLLKSCYVGCCMSFRRKCLDFLLPFPPNLNAYDQYIGAKFEKRKTSFFIDDVFIKHRIHGNNCTRRLKLVEKVKFRVVLLSCYLHKGNQFK